MNMRIATEIEVKLIEGISESEVPKCEIVAEKVATGRIIAGAYIEAAIQWGNYYLLFITDDCPFEEILRIYLLSKQWLLLDAAVIGCIYSTGSFSALKLTEPNRVQFRFFADTNWEVEAFDRPQFRLPWFGEPAGVMRKFGFSRHFLVRENPKPEVIR
jgi:hypothetical protein